MKRTTILSLFFAFLISFAAGCTVDSSHAMHVLKGQGYTDIHLGGHAWYDCSEDDSVSVNFTAKGPTGVHVEGALCCGFMAKNCTVRLD
jgi:hypothetical protein